MRRLLNIVSLTEAGYKVSELCLMSDDRLARLLDTFYASNGNETAEYFISQLIAAGTNFDEPYFNKIFVRCISKYKLKQAYLLVLLPMLSRIGLLWKCDKATVAHEHFISNLIRQKLFAAADSIPPAPDNAPTWLLFLPENELHDIGLLMAHNLVRLSGQRAIYLGSNLPREVLAGAIRQVRPDNVFIFLVDRRHGTSLGMYLAEVGRSFGEGQIYVASRTQGPTSPLGNTQRLHWLRTPDEFSTLLPGRE